MKQPTQGKASWVGEVADTSHRYESGGCVLGVGCGAPAGGGAGAPVDVTVDVISRRVAFAFAFARRASRVDVPRSKSVCFLVLAERGQEPTHGSLDVLDRFRHTTTRATR